MALLSDSRGLVPLNKQNARFITSAVRLVIGHNMDFDVYDDLVNNDLATIKGWVGGDTTIRSVQLSLDSITNTKISAVTTIHYEMIGEENPLYPVF